MGMSYVIAAPEIMTSAASDLATIGSNLHAAHTAAAAPTLAVMPAAADEVSVCIAHLFSLHAGDYQALAARAAAFQDQFVQNLTAGAFSYASIEATIASLLQGLNVTADQLVSLFERSPIQFALGTLLFLVEIPVFVVLLPLLLPIAAILVAA
jgi:hypothetical protein